LTGDQDKLQGWTRNLLRLVSTLISPQDTKMEDEPVSAAAQAAEHLNLRKNPQLWI